MAINIRTITLQVCIKNKSERDIDLSIKKFSDKFELAKTMFDGDIRTFRTVCEQIKVSDLKSDADANLLYFLNSNKKYGTWGHCIPFLIDDEDFNIGEIVCDLIKDGAFVNMSMTDDNGSISLPSIAAASKIMLDISNDNPMDNFRFGASSGSKNKTPFFPFSVANNDMEFVVGLEIINFIYDIIIKNKRKNLKELKDLIVRKMSDEVLKIEEVCLDFSRKTGFSYGGIDLSMAPYPYPLEEQSVCKLIELIGNIGRSRGDSLFSFGSSGTYFLNSYLTDILKDVSKRIKSTGFCGVMYSLLEDSDLSEAYSEGKFGIDFLKLMSTTCGCGIDMVPVPGGVDDSFLYGTIIDTVSSSIVLNKPLGVRMLPVSGLRPGDRTSFKHLFFSNTEVKSHKPGVKFQNLPGQTRLLRLRGDDD